MKPKDPHSVPSLWEKVAHNLQEFYSEAVGWTGEKARIGVKRMDILGIQRQIRRHMTELGGRVYDQVKQDASLDADQRVQGLIDAIRRLEEELEAREREIDGLRGRRGTETPGDPSPAQENPAATSGGEEPGNVAEER